MCALRLWEKQQRSSQLIFPICEWLPRLQAVAPAAPQSETSKEEKSQFYQLYPGNVCSIVPLQGEVKEKERKAHFIEQRFSSPITC